MTEDSIYATWGGGSLDPESGHGECTYVLHQGNVDNGNDPSPGWTTEAGLDVIAYELRVDEETYEVKIGLLIGEDLYLTVPLWSLLRTAPPELMSAVSEGAMELADEVRASLEAGDDDGV